MVYLSWGKGLLRARSNWRHAVAVTLPIIGESNKLKQNISKVDAILFLKLNENYFGVDTI